MEFDRSRVYTSLNADELRAGDWVIVADDMLTLKAKVSEGFNWYVVAITSILGEEWYGRFDIDKHNFPLAYLVERAKNCTNCEGCVSCIKPDKTFVCEDWKLKTEQKAEKDCDNCGQRCDGYGKGEVCSQWKSKTEQDCQSCKYKNCGFKDFNTKNECDRWEAEKHYRPFRDTDELIKVWEEKTGATPYWGKGADLVMPHIWVRHKKVGSRALITDFVDDWSVIVGNEGNGLRALLNNYTFLDGSTCGVEE